MASFPPPPTEAKGGWTYADPRVLEGLVRLDPLLRVDRQHLVDEVLGLGRHGVPLGGRVLKKTFCCFHLIIFIHFRCVKRETHVVGSGLDLRVQPVLVLVPEGRVAHEEDVEYDPAGPDVHGLAVGLLLEHLRGEVAGGAGEPEPGLLVALHLDGQAEVGELDGGALLLARQQQVLRLKGGGGIKHTFFGFPNKGAMHCFKKLFEK